MSISATTSKDCASPSISTIHYVESAQVKARGGWWTWVLLGCVVVSIQMASGAFQVERGNYSDEAAHFLNGLLLRDYLWTGGDPLAFAQAYYLNFPKVAPMMWPPLFHTVLGILLLPGWAPQAASLLLVAAATTWTAWRVYRVTEAISTRLLGYVMAGVLLATPAVIDMTNTVMLDIVVAAVSLEAAYWFARFARSEATRDALVFGFLAAACCLTKGNGLSIVLVPVLYMLLTGSWHLMKHRGLWFAAATIVLLAFPLVLISFRIDSGMGGYSAVDVSRIVSRARFYSLYLARQLGFSITALALAGIMAKDRWYRTAASDRRPLIVAMMSLLVAALLFHVLNPVESVAARYITLAIPPLVILSAAGLMVTVGLTPRYHTALYTALLVVMIANFVVARPAATPRIPLGYREATTALETRFGLAGRRSLIVSDESGEGAFVAEVATRELAPRPTVIRGSKLLASDDWDGRDFQLKFASAPAIAQELEDLHVDFVLLDQTVEMPYTPLLQRMLRDEPDRFELVQQIQGSRRVAVYRVLRASAGPAKEIEVEVAALRRVLR